MPTRHWVMLRAFTGLTGGGLLRARRNGNVSRRKKALLIGINYHHDPLSQLALPQRDMKEMRALLKEIGFQDEDIITLTDDEDEIAKGSSHSPNHENITKNVREFINRGQDDTDYVLFYSGHSEQHDDPDGVTSVEEDGKIEYIRPVDAKTDPTGEYPEKSVIYDKYLHKYIVKPLEGTKGCHLFAVLDSCHSATLLNLRHHRCNRIGTFKSAVRRAIRHFIVEDALRKTQIDSPGCNGFCPRVPNWTRKSTVICISACKDSEVAIEHGAHDTLASAIIKLLRANPKSSIKDVMYAVRNAAEGVQKAAEECSGKWGKIPVFNRFISPPKTSSEEEKLVAKWNPQLSSNDPLDTNTTLLYSDIRTQKLDKRGRVKRSALDMLKHLKPVKAGAPNLSLPTRKSSS